MCVTAFCNRYKKTSTHILFNFCILILIQCNHKYRYIIFECKNFLSKVQLGCNCNRFVLLTQKNSNAQLVLEKNPQKKRIVLNLFDPRTLLTPGYPSRFTSNSNLLNSKSSDRR